MASASFLKSSPILDKSEFVKGQPLLRQSSSPAVRLCNPRAAAASPLTIRASSYADELVKTAVRTKFQIFFKKKNNFGMRPSVELGVLGNASECH